MNSSMFNLTFSAGDECYAVLTGLDRSMRAARLEKKQMAEFASRFDQLRREVVNGSVTIDRTAMFENVCNSCVLDTLDTLMYWLDEDVIDDVVVHPKAVVHEAVTALKGLRDGMDSVIMGEEATWEIQDCAEMVEQIETEKLEAAQKVFDRAKDQLPPNACWHGIEGHNHSGLS